jgi:hypothetical protein
MTRLKGWTRRWTECLTPGVKRPRKLAVISRFTESALLIPDRNSTIGRPGHARFAGPFDAYPILVLFL